MKRDRVIAMFLGVAIGDALGMPVETLPAKQIADQYGWIADYIEPKGHPWYGDWPAGHWTDDAQLTLAIAESLIANKGINVDDIAKRHIQAMEESSIGWGGSTLDSIERIKKGTNRLQSGKPQGAGNGIAMKVSPIAAFLFSLKVAEIADHDDTIIELALMTHKSDMAVLSGFVQIYGLLYCLTFTRQFTTQEFLRFITTSLNATEHTPLFQSYEMEKLEDNLVWRISCLDELARKKIAYSSLSQIASYFNGATCYVYNSLPFSLAMFMRNPHSIETLYDTINAGGDTDTNGSMVGALLGALNGIKIFPQHLINGLWEKDQIIDCAQRFCDCFDIQD